MLLAGNPNRDAKYAATLALVRSRSADALPVLRSVATDPGAGASRLFAHIGLAAAGDAESLKAVNDALPFMKGRDLLESGRALAALKDPRGTPILRSMIEGGDESLRVEAAEAFHDVDAAFAARAIRAACSSSNPWVRAQALDAAARLRIAATPAMRRAMLDSNSWVAINALQAVAADTQRVAEVANAR
jgi:HEAT repeat protein